MNLPCHAAIVQHPPVFLNLAASLDRADTLIAEAAAQGAGLVVFPETWLPGYPIWLDEAPRAGLWNEPGAKRLYQALADNAVELPGAALDRLLGTTKRLGIWLVMGVNERAGGTLYNTMLFVAPDGETWSIHRKLIPTYTERLVWGQGDGSTLATVDTPFGALGGLVCWEHWMPLARAAMHAKREAIHVAQWPTAHDLHQLASRQYAFEGQCFVLSAGTVLTRDHLMDGLATAGLTNADVGRVVQGIRGEGDTRLMRGGSAVIAPDASYLAGPVLDDVTIVYATLDPALVTQGHLVMDSAGHYARPDVFHLEVDTRERHDVRFG